MATAAVDHGHAMATALDEAATRLLAACLSRFPPPEYEVRCDERYTVWVKQSAGGHSVGLPPWQLRLHTVDELLDRVAAKLRG